MKQESRPHVLESRIDSKQHGPQYFPQKDNRPLKGKRDPYCCQACTGSSLHKLNAGLSPFLMLATGVTEVRFRSGSFRAP